MSYDEVIRLALERGFFSPSSEIYSDAPAGFWEYGPLGLALRRRYQDLWRRELVRKDGMIEIDGSLIMSKSVFAASGHLQGFVDPMIVCKKCNTTHRADRLISEKIGKQIAEGLSEKEFDQFIAKHAIRCPIDNGELGRVRKFNMMFRVGIGPSDESAYLRPETCQSIFVDFPRLYKVMRCKLPVPFAQLGKSFRNEVSPRQSLIRLRELYQAEIEVFFNPSKGNEFPKFDDVKDYELRLLSDSGVKSVSCGLATERGLVPSHLVAYYLAILQQFYEKTGIDMQRGRFRRLEDSERAFYSQFALDFEVQTSLGWTELVACNYRTDYDMKRHGGLSRKDVSVYDDAEKVIPHVFELSMGVDRSLYCILEHSFVKEKDRNVLKLRPSLAPIQVGVFPLVNKDGLPNKAEEIFDSLKYDFDATYDDAGSIGRRYRRIDEIGTPYAITVDYQTKEDDSVTLRERDSMSQKRITSAEVPHVVRRLLNGEPFSS